MRLILVRSLVACGIPSEDLLIDPHPPDLGLCPVDVVGPQVPHGLLNRIVWIAVVKSEAPFGPLSVVYPLWRAAGIVTLHRCHRGITYPSLLVLMIFFSSILVVILSSRIIVRVIVILLILSTVLRCRCSLRVILLLVREVAALTW